MKEAHKKAVAKAKKVQAKQTHHLNHMYDIGASHSPSVLDERVVLKQAVKSQTEQIIRERY